MVRFSGLFKSNLPDSLMDGNRGGNHQYGVGMAKFLLDNKLQVEIVYLKLQE